MSSSNNIVTLAPSTPHMFNSMSSDNYATRPHWHGNNFSIIIPLPIKPDQQFLDAIYATVQIRVYFASDGSLVVDFGTCSNNASYTLYDKIEQLYKEFTDRKVVVPFYKVPRRNRATTV